MSDAIRRLIIAGTFCAAAGGAVAQGTPATIEAVTRDGDKVLLHPNGRWEYVDAGKAAAAKEVSAKFPENQGCPPGTQGGLFGIGRCIPRGDPDYNRGSLNPNRR